MARTSKQQVLNEHFASEQAELQARIHLLEEGLSALIRVATEVFDGLRARHVLDLEGQAAIDHWHEALAALRSAGLKDRPLPGGPREETPSVTCPQCRSVLRNIQGAPGDRCDWCGHVFELVCPACGRTLSGQTGEPGDVCLHCQHRF
jgi:DNA-directed RNA polymerase subunit RPC12/RpoP